MDPECIAVELYADGLDGDEPVSVPMVPAEAIAGAVNGWIYQTSVGTDRPVDHYTPRVIPRHAEALVPVEAPEILWLH